MTKAVNFDKLIRAISLLKALRDSIKDARENDTLYDSQINEFHAILSDIANMGIDVIKFLITDLDEQPKPLSTSMNGSRYSTEWYVPKSILRTKLDDILIYLNYILKKPKRSAGFKPKK